MGNRDSRKRNGLRANTGRDFRRKMHADWDWGWETEVEMSSFYLAKVRLPGKTEEKCGNCALWERHQVFERARR